MPTHIAMMIIVLHLQVLGQFRTREYCKEAENIKEIPFIEFVNAGRALAGRPRFLLYLIRTF